MIQFSIPVYVEANNDCNTLAFQFGAAGGNGQPAVAARSWSIKVN